MFLMRIAGIALIAVVLTGCGPCPGTTCAIAVEAGPDGLAHAGPALEATAAQFLGPPARSTPGAGSVAGPVVGPRLSLGRDTLSPNSGTPHQRGRDRRMGLRMQMDMALSDHVSLNTALTLAHGQSHHLLPEGIGPLADPMRIRFDRIALTPEIGLAWTRSLPDVAGLYTTVTLNAGMGREVSRVRTQVRSALLDVTNVTTIQQNFVSLGAGLSVSPAGSGPQLQTIVQARQFKGGDRTIHAALRLWH